jgi:hypothetical protein
MAFQKTKIALPVDHLINSGLDEKDRHQQGSEQGREVFN